MTSIVIITIVLALLGVLGIFIPVVPAVIISYAALVCGHIAGAFYIDAKVMIFWGVATVIVIGLRSLQRGLASMRSGNGYVAGGALVGTFLGYLVAPMASGLILGGAIGSFLGAMAYMRSPMSPRLAVSSRGFMDFLCVKGLAATVALSMSAISILSVL